MTNATFSASESIAKIDAMTADIKRQVEEINADDVQRALDTLSKGAATLFVLFAVAVITLLAMAVELWQRHGMTARCKSWAIAAVRVWVAGVSIIAFELPPGCSGCCDRSFSATPHSAAGRDSSHS